MFSHWSLQVNEKLYQEALCPSWFQHCPQLGIFRPLLPLLTLSMRSSSLGLYFGPLKWQEVCWAHRLFKSFRLEQTSKIIRSDHQPMPTMPLILSLSATPPQLWNTSRDGDFPTSLGSLGQCITAFLKNKCFLITKWTSPGTTWGQHVLLQFTASSQGVAESLLPSPQQWDNTFASMTSWANRNLLQPL